MKFLALSLLLSLSSLSLWAGNNTPDYYGEVFNERMSERYPDRQIQDFELLDQSETPAKLIKFEEHVLDRLLFFAQTYDLFNVGWSYAINTNVYRVTNANGKVIGYNFSIDLHKNNEYKSRRFYQASIRADGVYYVERIANYDIE